MGCSWSLKAPGGKEGRGGSFLGGPAEHHPWRLLLPTRRGGFGRRARTRGRAPFGACGLGRVDHFFFLAVPSWLMFQ